MYVHRESTVVSSVSSCTKVFGSFIPEPIEMVNFNTWTNKVHAEPSYTLERNDTSSHWDKHVPSRLRSEKVSEWANVRALGLNCKRDRPACAQWVIPRLTAIEDTRRASVLHFRFVQTTHVEDVIAPEIQSFVSLHVIGCCYRMSTSPRLPVFAPSMYSSVLANCRFMYPSTETKYPKRD